MEKLPVLLSDLADFLAMEFATDRFPISERGGIYQPSDRPAQYIGLALEPWPGIGEWVRSHQVDAIWLHRPWQLHPGTLPTDVGVLYHHLPFDECLTTGYNRRLANVFGMESLEELGYKQTADEPNLPKRPIGMIGNVPERTYDEWLDLIQREYGGYDQAVHGKTRTCERVAVVGAMNAALIQEAHERGVSLYLTGEYRKGAQKAVDETGLSVVAIGHRRTEEWGLRALGQLLNMNYQDIRLIIQ